LCRFDLEAAIKLGDVMLAQEGIRRLHRSDPTQAQMLGMLLCTKNQQLCPKP